MDSDYIILCLYVYDILIFKTSLETILKVNDYLSQNFDMKDLGPPYMILKMMIFMEPKGISLSLSHNIEKILHRFDFFFFKCKPIFLPYDSLIALKKNTGELISQQKYSQLIGSLLYVSNRTRPDMCATGQHLI